MSGDPDVLEYYKNDHSKKPLRIINLNFCEQVDAGLTFNKKELQDSFVFDIKTSERTFYLVAETEEDMNKWVQSICQICGFNQAEESTESSSCTSNGVMKPLILLTNIQFTGRPVMGIHFGDSLRNLSSASHGPRSSPAELSSSSQHLLRERKSSAPSHSSQPTLFTFEPPVSNHMQPALSTSAPQEYLYLHQCISRRAENARSASFSQGTRASFLMRSDTAVQKLAQGNGHCVNGVSGQVHGFYSLPKPSRHNTEFRDSTYDLPRSLASHGHTKGSLTGSETDNEDVYTFKTPSNTLCREFGDLLVDNMDVPATPLSAYQIPRTFTLDKNHNAMAVATPGDSAIAPPPRPPKPSQAETPRWGSPQQRPPINESSRSISAAATIPRRNTLPAMDNSRLHRASSCESYEYPQRGGDSAGRSAESVSDAVTSFLPGKTIVGRSESTNSEDNYVPMNPGSSTLLATERAGDNSQSVYIPMSPGPHHFEGLSYPSTALSMHRGPSRGSEIQPPPVNRNLKPDRKVKPTPLDLRNNTVIDELPFKSPVTKSWSRAIHTFNCSSSQYCRPISTQSITSTDSGDSEENYVPMQNPVSASPIPSGTNSPAPKKSTGSVDYLALDFQPGSPSPHRKPSTSSVTSDEKVDYVQVDKEKTQALQNTMQEWTDVRQSSEPSKGAKL
ncbi:GRB2-associated-binding protein 2 isoform X1 [Ailuropoda melanoleuca]|uniref:GRB2-associated-binding protein 2 isoform X1 n=1 Tax=Ailuropoda melanoleuca TaxID=9646 RepID=UPI001494DE36|nr:GRB2-associated-binding protein 2 isoform X1 [Ailuropoda melanoleuca]